MKILKGIFYVILAIIALFLIVALFLPSEYKVERSVQINKPVGVVYDYVADFNNFHEWNPWTQFEPGHSYEVSGDSAAVGQKYFWKGEIIGSGQMIFTNLKQNESINATIEFLPEQGTGVVEWIFDGDSTSTSVNWILTGSADYPVGRYMGIMMDSFLGQNFEDGMQKLKEKCEAK